MKAIYLLPLEKIDPEIVQEIKRAVESEFGLSCKITEASKLPKEAYNPLRGQYYSSLILEKLSQRKPRDPQKVLAIADNADLYVPQLNFVFGEANPSENIALISLYRLREEFYGQKPDKKLLVTRSIKEAVHELGHVFGLAHCYNANCVMYFSNSLSDTDRKSCTFCPACKKQLRENLSSIGINT